MYDLEKILDICDKNSMKEVDTLLRKAVIIGLIDAQTLVRAAEIKNGPLKGMGFMTDGQLIDMIVCPE